MELPGPVGTRFDSDPPVLVGTNLYALSATYSSQDASWHSSIYAFNAATGEKLWNYTVAGQFGFLQAADQNLYVTSNFVDTRNNLDAQESGGYIYEGGILALNAATGTKTWSYPINSSVNAPAVVNNTVYATSNEGTLYAFNAADGKTSGPTPPAWA
jgi:outer membrane protein assembly factor BamB